MSSKLFQCYKASILKFLSSTANMLMGSTHKPNDPALSSDSARFPSENLVHCADTGGFPASLGAQVLHQNIPQHEFSQHRIPLHQTSQHQFLPNRPNQSIPHVHPGFPQEPILNLRVPQRQAPQPQFIQQQIPGPSFPYNEFPQYQPHEIQRALALLRQCFSTLHQPSQQGLLQQSIQDLPASEREPPQRPYTQREPPQQLFAQLGPPQQPFTQYQPAQHPLAMHQPLQHPLTAHKPLQHPFNMHQTVQNARVEMPRPPVQVSHAGPLPIGTPRYQSSFQNVQPERSGAAGGSTSSRFTLRPCMSSDWSDTGSDGSNDDWTDDSRSKRSNLVGPAQQALGEASSRKTYQYDHPPRRAA